MDTLQLPAAEAAAYRNLGNGRFEDVSLRAGTALLERRRRAAPPSGDLFNTGMQDIVVNNMNDPPSLLHNCATPAGHGLLIELCRHALQPQRDRCARDGVRLQPPAHRRGAQRRQLFCTTDLGAIHTGPREPECGPRRSKLPGQAAQPGRFPRSRRISSCSLREGSVSGARR